MSPNQTRPNPQEVLVSAVLEHAKPNYGFSGNKLMVAMAISTIIPKLAVRVLELDAATWRGLAKEIGSAQPVTGSVHDAPHHAA